MNDPFTIYSVGHWRTRGVLELQATRDAKHLHNPSDPNTCFILPKQPPYTYGGYMTGRDKEWFLDKDKALAEAERRRLAGVKRLWAKLDELVNLEFT